jgi:hypothetical protein
LPGRCPSGAFPEGRGIDPGAEPPDPGLDPDGRYAALLTGILVAGLRHLGRGRVGFRVDI